MEMLRFLTGGLNTDDSVEVMSPEDYSNAENVVIGKTYDGKTGVIENILGTTAITVASSLVDAESTPIGVIKSAKDNLNFIFYYHQDSDKHSIVKVENNTASKVITWSGLNFQKEKAYRINGGGLVGNLLYFTDNYNEPRCINITRYTSSNPSTEEEILLIKRGPQTVPVPVKVNSGSGNDILLKQWQFACQYVYFDGQYSVLSPYSLLTKKYSITESYNTINVIFPNETAPRLVKERKMFAREGNTGSWYEIGSTSRSSIGGSWPASVIVFKGTLSGQPLEVGYQKSSELAPVVAKCMAISSNRLWLANYNNGYDKYSSSNIAINSAAISVNSGSVSTFTNVVSGNSRYKYGFLLRDQYGRSGGVITNSSYTLEVGNMFTDTYTDQPQYGKLSIDATLGSLPSWAKYVSVVISEDLTKQSYIEERTNAILYSKGSSISLSSTGKTNIRIYHNTFLERSHGFTPQQGDIVSFTFNGAEQNITVEEFIPNDDGSAIIVCSFKDMGTFGSFEARHFQIYRPKEQSSDIFYYEQFNSISAITGSSKNVTFTHDPSILELSNSNGIYNYRQMFLDLYNTWDTDKGRPFIETRVDGVDKKLYFKHSSTFIADTDVNGLSEFNLGDEGQVGIDAGEIQKLVPTVRDATESSTILAICNSDTYSVYVGEAQLSTSEGSGFIVGSPNIIGDTRKNQSGYGTLHPESVIEKNGEVFWYDHLARAYCRYATNGIFPISDYKMVKFFEDLSMEATSNEIILSGYDPFYKSVMVSYPPTLLISNETFKENISGWTSVGSGGVWAWDGTYESAKAPVTSATPTEDFTWVLASTQAAGSYTSKVRLFRVGSSAVNVTVSLYNDAALVQELHNVTVNYTSVQATSLAFTASGSFNKVIIRATTASSTPDIYVASYELYKVHTSKTVSFSIDRNRWSSFYGFSPLGFVEASDYLISLFNNAIVKHNNSSAFGSVNGVSYKPKLALSFNDSPNIPKDWKVIQLQGSFNLLQFSGGEEQVADTDFKITATNKRGQSTTVLYDEFEVDEDLIYGTLLCDENSPGGLLDGDSIYSPTLQVEVEWGGTSHKWLNFLNAGFESSTGHRL